MLFRSLETISFERNMLFRSLEISFAILDALGLARNYFVPSKSFRSNEICYFVPRFLDSRHKTCPAKNETCHKCGKKGLMPLPLA